MLRITVDQSHTFEVEKNRDGITVDGAPLAWDLVAGSPNQFHILYTNRSFRAEIVQIDHAAKSVIIKLNNQVHQVQVKDQLDQLLERLGMGNGSAAVAKDVKAPMPGLIVDVKVTEGQTVQKGDALVILEAMKMENIIKSPVDGVVKTVKASRGQRVEKNALLVGF